MREILFRGKRDTYGESNGEWVYGSLLYDPDFELVQIWGFNYYATDEGEQREPFECVVSSETVGEFTGLTDKNSVKIFEGDVLKNTLDNSIAIVKWGSAHTGFVLETKGTVYALARTGCEVYKVIGNIHDDPELLEGGKSK